MIAMYQPDDPIAILRAETACARIEGILHADPDLAAAWRAEAAFVEAATSAGFEDARLPVAAIILRLTGNAAPGFTCRATDSAARLLGLLKAPPRILADPVAALRRIEAAGRPIGQPPDPADRPSEDEIAAMFARAEGLRDMPVLAGLKAAAEYAHLSRRSAPMVERLIFACVEGEARRLRGLDAPGGGGEDAATAVFAPVRAGWTVLPASALMQAGMPVWAPLSGQGAIIAAMATAAGRALGHLGVLRHEVGRLRAAAAAAHGRSRLRDAVDLVRTRQIVTSAMVMEALGVSRKTALSLLGTLAGAGCLDEITSRRAARVWATPSLARHLRTAREAPRRHGQAGQRRAPATPPLDMPAPAGMPWNAGFDPARLERLMAGLDAAMAGLDGRTRR